MYGRLKKSKGFWRGGKECGFSGREFEIVVIDDNSPDGTQEVVKKLQKSFGADKVVGLL